MPKNDEDKNARDYLEEKDVASLTDGEHIALAIYYVGDVIFERIDSLMLQDDDDEE